jgi:sirohydrochlorin ferrochelatase
VSSSKPAVVLVGHGSKALDFARAMGQVAEALSQSGRWSQVRPAYLEITKPSIPEAVAACVADGANEVRVLPYFVLTGRHVTEDIPLIVADLAKAHAGKAKIVLCPYLGYDEALVKLVEKRLEERG